MKDEIAQRIAQQEQVVQSIVDRVRRDRELS
jgi:hypothetical protein